MSNNSCIQNGSIKKNSYQQRMVPIFWIALGSKNPSNDTALIDIQAVTLWGTDELWIQTVSWGINDLCFHLLSTVYCPIKGQADQANDDQPSPAYPWTMLDWETSLAKEVSRYLARLWWRYCCVWLDITWLKIFWNSRR